MNANLFGHRVLSVFLFIVGLAAFAMTAAQAQAFSVIHNFSGGQDGANPFSGLTIDGAGNFYGTTEAGANGFGNVFKLVHSGSSWIVTPLYVFSGGADGANPRSRVVIGPDGGLYGTTQGGGISRGCFQCGTVFKLSPPATICHAVSCPWTETVLHRFTGGSDGGWPTGDLVFDGAGNIYGTTAQGGLQNCSYGLYGCGTVFELTRGSWQETVLYAFQSDDEDGASPEGGVVFGPDGNLYGTVLGGPSDWGMVFQLKHSGSGWTENTLYQFHDGSDGGDPEAGLIVDSAGTLYGTTYQGTHGGGGVFKLSPSGDTWIFSPLHGFEFSYNGGPHAALSMDAAGNLYGSTIGWGTYSYGSIFKLSLQGGSWIYTDLYDFSGPDGLNPECAPVLDGSGNIYGTTINGGSGGYGVVFEIAP